MISILRVKPLAKLHRLSAVLIKHCALSFTLVLWQSSCASQAPDLDTQAHEDQLAEACDDVKRRSWEHLKVTRVREIEAMKMQIDFLRQRMMIPLAGGEDILAIEENVYAMAKSIGDEKFAQALREATDEQRSVARVLSRREMEKFPLSLKIVKEAKDMEWPAMKAGGGQIIDPLLIWGD